MRTHKKVVALEARLKGCKNVITLGVRPDFSDYSREEKALIRGAEKIYYPSAYYVDMLDVMGKKLFPSAHTYRFAQDKIKQTTLFKLLGIPGPRTKTFYGRTKAERIIKSFDYPFVAKMPRGSAMGRGVYLISNRAQLEEYCTLTKVAYIQEYLPIDRDIRLVVIGDRVVHAYWRIAAPREFRSNVGLGGKVSFDKIPARALDLALFTARACGWNDVGLDICFCHGAYYVLEANMKYGREGFRQAGIDYVKLMEKLIGNGEI